MSQSKKSNEKDLKELSQQIEKELELLLRLKCAKLVDLFLRDKDREKKLIEILHLPKDKPLKESLQNKWKEMVKKNFDFNITRKED